MVGAVERIRRSLVDRDRHGLRRRIDFVAAVNSDSFPSHVLTSCTSLRIDFYSVAGTAPLLSRLGLFRSRLKVFANVRESIRAATVMERFRGQYQKLTGQRTSL